MWLTKGNLHTKLTRSTPEEREWLVNYLTFEGERKGPRQPPTPVRLFNMLNDTYPSGFDAFVAKAGPEEGFEVKFIDPRTPPCAPDPSADLVWLRDYQLGAVQAVVEQHRGILWLPTGAGKTEVAVGITRALPCQWLAVVHRSQLADDIASRYEKRSPGLYAGRILEGRFEVHEDSTLIAATYQSIAKLLERGVKHGLKDDLYLKIKHLIATWAEGLIVDECHTLPASTFYRLAMQTKSAYYRVGLSGTPLARGDKKNPYLYGAIGKPIYRVKSQLLIDRGVLAKPTVRLVTCTQQSLRPTWTGVQGELIVRSKVRNGVVLGMAQRAKKPGFVFVQQVEHGKQLAKALTNAGIPSEFVWGNHSIDYRKSLIKRLEQGHFEMLVCSTVFNEGIDVPALRSVVNGGGGKSLIATFQRLGRGMRVDRKADGSVHEGGDEFEVWDVLDKGNKWLERHARMRQSAYASEGYATFVEPEPPQPSSRAHSTPAQR
jgi:superfamily II DNA or RNA helicase